MAKPRSPTDYHQPERDGLIPVWPVDLARIHSISDLMKAYHSASFGARRLGSATEVLETMVRDQGCKVVLTLSGAMTVAKMGLVICEMIERGYVHLIISTGALMTHGLVESSGHCHYRHPPNQDDRTLYEQGYNRVYDTLEPESNLDEAEKVVRAVLDHQERPAVLSSRWLTETIGSWLCTRFPDLRGPLASAYRHGVPILIPALTDSELGLDLATHHRRLQQQGLPTWSYDPFLDLEYYAEWAQQPERLGIFTIGGGVPRNYAQQVGPFLELREHRLGSAGKPVRFQYGVRICPDSEHLGGLSGCTYREGVSWGKFVPEEEGGRYAEVLSDATIAWPLIVKAVMERIPLQDEPVAKPRHRASGEAPGEKKAQHIQHM